MKGRTYCVARAPNDVSYKNNTHIPGIFIDYFPKDVAVWPKWTRSTIDRRHRRESFCPNLDLNTAGEKPSLSAFVEIFV